jgi:uncharacterized protein YjdB
MRNVLLVLVLAACAAPTDVPVVDNTVQVVVPANVTVGSAVRLTARNSAGVPVSATWATSDPSKATVSTSGELRVFRPGAFTVSASTSNAQASSPSVAALDVSPLREVIQSVLLASLDTLPVGGKVQARVVLLDEKGGPVSLVNKFITWGSTNPAVATVDDSGLVTAVGGGHMCLTATLNGLSRCANVFVKGPVSTTKAAVVVTGPVGDLAVGQPGAVDVSFTAQDGARVALVPVVLGSHNELTVAVDATGALTTKRAGTATVSATVNNITRPYVVTVK